MEDMGVQGVAVVIIQVAKEETIQDMVLEAMEFNFKVGQIVLIVQE